MIVPILIAAAAVLGYAWCIVLWRRDGQDDRGGAVLLAICFTIAAVGPALGYVLATAGDARRLEAFYDTNAAIYWEARAALYEGVPSTDASDASGALFFDAANLQQVAAYRDTVATLRDRVTAYNVAWAQRSYWQSHVWAGWLYVDAAPHLDYIQP